MQYHSTVQAHECVPLTSERLIIPCAVATCTKKKQEKTQKQKQPKKAFKTIKC